ncbi:MAG TPA: FG-GAP repeat protein, partial [Streptosporangiaceae bacterium]|nr:FG-GAP repeat protein [Streptosporangiaceae bacterium]
MPASLQAAISKSLGAGDYSRQAELAASDGAPNDESGFSVALSALGTTALAGAWMRHSSTGAAYVFSLRGRTWSETAELTAPHGAPDDDFGISVALSAPGTTAMVGAPRHSGPGEAYVFRLRGRTWSQAAELTASHGTRGDLFGDSVGLSAPGTTAMVGAPGVNTGA